MTGFPCVGIIGTTACIQYEHMKESGFRVRVESTLRREFIDLCKSQDLTAAQVLRAYMRDYIERHKDVRQGELFAENREGNG